MPRPKRVARKVCPLPRNTSKHKNAAQNVPVWKATNFERKVDAVYRAISGESSTSLTMTAMEKSTSRSSSWVSPISGAEWESWLDKTINRFPKKKNSLCLESFSNRDKPHTHTRERIISFSNILIFSWKKKNTICSKDLPKRDKKAIHCHLLLPMGEKTKKTHTNTT